VTLKLSYILTGVAVRGPKCQQQGLVDDRPVRADHCADAKLPRLREPPGPDAGRHIMRPGPRDTDDADATFTGGRRDCRDHIRTALEHGPLPPRAPSLTTKMRQETPVAISPRGLLAEKPANASR
jgi:hypothetical protein